MKGQPNSPDFPTQDYVRPNTKWTCGRLAEGCACRIGPSPKGECRATFECQPKLELKPGEKTGRWACTRPSTAGGKCENGPMPDGTCCKPIPKCQPVRTLRSIRKRTSIFVSLATIIFLLISIGSNMRDAFINPGPLSSTHSGANFIKLSGGDPGTDTGCAACHESADLDVHAWTAKFFHAATGGLSPAKILTPSPSGSAPMDDNCMQCHAGNDFHQPNVAGAFACHTCHNEHETAGSLPPADSRLCIRCHASEALMADARELGKAIPAHDFPTIIQAGLNVFPQGRPSGGYTNTIESFHQGHPEFKAIREKAEDANSLKFNHALHLTSSEIPKLHGKPLDCAHCHQYDATGAYFQKMTYEAQCADCHALQFDENTPDLHLPHGDPYYVRSFLRSISIQYAEHAKAREGMTRAQELDAYVTRKTQQLRAQYNNSGEQLERAIFFADMQGRIEGGGRSPLPGCATCHDMTEQENAAPNVAEVFIPDRWMHVGEFHHARHNHIACSECHSMTNSELTSEVNLPSAKTCIECHSPSGGVSGDCTLCHTYHNDPPTRKPLKAE